MFCFLPPNSASIYQPIYQIIINFVKYRYRSDFKEKNSSSKHHEYGKESGAFLRMYRKNILGVKDANAAHVSDSIMIINDVCNKVSREICIVVESDTLVQQLILNKMS